MAGMRLGAAAVVVAAAALGAGGAAAAFDLTSALSEPSVGQDPPRPRPSRVEVPTIVPGTVFAWAPCPPGTERRGRSCVGSPTGSDSGEPAGEGDVEDD